MGPFGHRVVLLIEDPSKRELATSTRDKLKNLNGVCRAHFPPGTILNDSRYQYNSPPGVTTSRVHSWSIDSSGGVQCPRHRTAWTARNSNTRQVSLWCFDRNFTTLELDHNKLRELSYLLQGTGGGGLETMHLPIWYTKNKKTVSLDWHDQFR